ncbi:hypothetical protein C3L33_13418, partial [Rhododendron williamsianum]
MSSFLSIAPNLLPTLFPNRTRPTNPLLHPTHNVGLSNQRRTLCASGFGHVPFPDPDSAKGLIKDLFARANGFLYPIANADVSSNSDAVTGSKQGGDWFSGVVIDMGGVLKVLKDGLSAVHVPYAYGFAIILLAVLVKVATFPLTKNQIKSTVAMRSLQPQIKVIQQRYAGDQERIQLETARLYKLAGFNPLGGCLPILATVPIWIGIYRALANVADEGLLTEGFFWIPSLAGPTAIATRQGGSAISWLFPFVDGHPLLGWPDTLAYLVLPVLLLLAQYTIVRITQSSQVMFTNTVLSTAQQVWLKNSWVAENPMSKLTDTIIEEEPPLVQTPIFLTSTTEKEPRAEMLPPQGPRPGERFRKIKEKEEKRRQQREEEKNKGEEAAVDVTQPNGAYGKETILGQGESGNEAETSVSSHGSGDSVTGINDASGTGNHVVNGDLSMLDSKEDQKTILEMESSEQSSNCKDGRGDQSLHGNLDKEEAVAAISKPDDELSGEDMVRDRSE